MEQLQQEQAGESPVWAVFGDLMAGMIGIFVLILVWVISYQLQLARSLEEEISRRQAEQEQRLALEQALAGPLASGRITLQDGRIGISGSVLFALNSDRLQSEGRELLRTLVAPLRVYLGQRDELLMVSGFTDDLQIHAGNNRFRDNWELSAQRALTVTRALVEEGMPPHLVFAAAFGSQQPLVPNVDDRSRSRNRRVEMAPVPRSASSD
jgi:flagellar motor protein MotB